MPVNSVWLDIDGAHVAPGVEEALEKLDSADGEMVLDFSSVGRIDTRALKGLEKLASAADHKALKLVLRGVNVRTYKALKLAKLVPRFAFVT